MAFLSVLDFLDFVDHRRIADFLVDDNTRPTEATMLDPTTAANRRIRLALERATDLICSACSVAARYSRGDLEALVVPTGTSGGYNTYGPDARLLQQLTADLAFGELVKRRALPPDEVKAVAPAYAGAMEYLEALRRGERIFESVAGVPEAGLTGTTPMSGFPPAGPNFSQTAVRYFGAIPQTWPYPYPYPGAGGYPGPGGPPW